MVGLENNRTSRQLDADCLGLQDDPLQPIHRALEEPQDRRNLPTNLVIRPGGASWPFLRIHEGVAVVLRQAPHVMEVRRQNHTKPSVALAALARRRCRFS